jgi:hypothetical protein
MVFPEFDTGEKVMFVLIDNLRYDQWLVLRKLLTPYFIIKKETQYLSILPTATQYARNSLFAGLMPSEIAKKYPEMWKEETDEGSKNQYEKEMLYELLKRNGREKDFSFYKILNLQVAQQIAGQAKNLLNKRFNVIVYNFVDMLSHARTEMEIIKELAQDEKAYRSLTLSWFKHSPLLEIIKYAWKQGYKVIITTDHGSVKVKDPVKVIGDRNTNTNLRYKVGKNLSFNEKEVITFGSPEKIYLPKPNVSSTYIFAKEYTFFVYPNQYHYYVNFYRNTFQHGGVSMEEMLIPFVVMTPKS